MNRDKKLEIYSSAKRIGLHAAKLLSPQWSDADFVALDALSKKNLMDASDLLTVLVSESHDLNPAARNPHNKYDWPIAVGLNQITRTAAASAGLIPGEKVPGDQSNFDSWKIFADKVVAMTVSEQLPIVDTYYAKNPRTLAGKPWPSATQIYAANAAASFSVSDVSDNTVIYPKGSPGYLGNTGLDLDGSGEITGKDMRLAVEYHQTTPLYQAAFLRLGAPAIRAGYLKGWQDAAGRFPSNPSTTLPVDGDFFAVGYLDGFDAGSRAPANAPGTLPAYLA